MTRPEAEIKFALWKAPQIPLEIEYSVGVMDEIQAAACAALREVPAGEREIGGVLFGEHQQRSIRIQTWRPIVCQHADGPSLRLLARDRVELACLLELARRSDDLRELQPVGWFVSHPRTGVGLCPSDLEVYHSFFPYAWQTTLVVQPAKDGHARCGFFVRDADGTLRSDSSYREFDLDPVDLPAPARTSPIFSWAEAAESRDLPVDPKPKIPAASQFAPALPQAAGAAPLFAERPPRELGLFLKPQAATRWFWAIPILLVLALGFFLLKLKSSPRVEPFSVQVLGTGETLQVAWDRNLPLMREARVALLDIRDGSKSTQYSLSPGEIRAGTLSYMPQSRDVSLVMTVYPPTGPAVQGFGKLIVPSDPPSAKAAVTPEPVSKAGVTSTSVSSTPASSAAPASPETDELRAERDSLRTQVSRLEETVRKEAAERNRLETLVRILENRLNIPGGGTHNQEK